jgi:hypothetical protein
LGLRGRLRRLERDAEKEMIVIEQKGGQPKRIARAPSRYRLPLPRPAEWLRRPQSKPRSDARGGPGCSAPDPGDPRGRGSLASLG